MITKIIKSDITKTELKYIAHGVNCQNVMGSGVAKVIYTEFPEVKEYYHNYSEQFQYGNQKQLLGEIQSVKSKGKVIYNCFTQLNYGYDGERYLSYTALVDCFKQLKESLAGEIIAIPKIGCGLAGGNWDFVVELINDTVGNDLEIWVYEL
jgi:O-acetyl-ADP-ribose deacetylase (regulator of RNase III)